MLHRLPRLTWLFVLLLGVGLPAAAQLRYDFDLDAQGWQVEAGGRAIHKTDAGKHGGYLRVTDETFEDMLMVAPAEALGDWRPYLGGTVSFAARNRNRESPDWSPFGELTLSGGGLSVVLDIAPEGSPPADGEWHRYGVRHILAARCHAIEGVDIRPCWLHTAVEAVQQPWTNSEEQKSRHNRRSKNLNPPLKAEQVAAEPTDE